jgi:hypothetical protein
MLKDKRNARGRKLLESELDVADRGGGHKLTKERI